MAERVALISAVVLIWLWLRADDAHVKAAMRGWVERDEDDARKEADRG